MPAFSLRDRIVHPELNEIRAGSQIFHVEPKVMSVLSLLAESPVKVVTKEQIFATVWAGVFVGDAVLTNAVSILRRVLGDHATHPVFIQTVPKRGYRLLVHPAACQDSAATIANAPERILLRARHLRHEETVSSLMQARGYAQEVATQEPGCAAAHAEVALATLLLEKIGAASRDELEADVRKAVDLALAAQSRSAGSYVAAAKVAYIYDWDWTKAETYFQRALTVDPADADAKAEFGIMLMNMRRFAEARRHLQQAYELDPLSPLATAQCAHSLFYQGLTPEAVEWYRRLLRLSPTHLFGRWCLAAALEHSSSLDSARNVISDGLNLHGITGVPLLVTLCRIHLMNNDVESAFSVLDQLKRLQADPLLLSHVYARSAERQTAIACLEEAAAQRHYRVSDVNVLPSFQPLREHSTFRSLMRCIGVEQK